MSDRSKLLIWSKDRACQLHLLLESINKHLPNTFDITVLYTHSDCQFKNGYTLAQSAFPNVDWVLEKGFNTDTLNIIDGCDNPSITVSTDDTVIYQTPPCKPFTYLSPGEVFSYRLGYNTIIQNHVDGMRQPPLNAQPNGYVLMWHTASYHPVMNYGYPFGLDMHCWNRIFFLNLIKRFHFNNTSELEGRLFGYRELCPLMSSFKHSVAVNIPFNKLSNTMYVGEQVFYTTKELNDRYLSGQTISLESIEKENIVGCHQVINLEFRNG